MFRFFTIKKWLLWSWLGTALILGSIWGQVQIDVAINDWFGDFCNLIQEALSEPGSINMSQYLGELASFGWLAALWIAVSLVVSFLTSHYLFRWRTAMTERYHKAYQSVSVEGQAQRVQEDTIKFTRLMESLGTALVESVMTIVAFIPILFTTAAGLSVMFFGDWQYGLIAGSLVWALGGTVFLIGLGWILRLVGIEYDLQKREAAYRKHLVKMEDDGSMTPKTLEELFTDVRKIHFQSYMRYLGFNVGRLAYLQANVLVGYILLAPAIVAGAITLGVMQQLLRAFGRVADSMQYILRAWPQVIELLSVVKRLREFEKAITK